MYRTSLLILMAGSIWLCTVGVHAQQHPILDQIAARVVQKYQTSSCEELAAQRARSAAGQRPQMEQRFVGVLRSNPQLRREFINRVAAPIANKLFECGLIP